MSKVAKGKLIDSDEGSDSECRWQINKSYACAYDKWRSKEEMQKLKDRYGDVSLKDDDEASTSEESEEDEGAEEITPQTERNFFLTLAALKANDAKLYDKDQKFFADDVADGVSAKLKPKNKSDQPLYPKDYQRNALLQRNGVFDDEDEDEYMTKRPAERKVSGKSKSYVEEQDEIKNSFKQIAVSSDEEGDEGFLKKRVKSSEEQKQEAVDYLEWLRGQKETCKDSSLQENLKVLHDYWNDPNIDGGEKFLRDYLLNHRYKDALDDEVPTYDEIVGDAEDFDEQDADTIEKQEEFERKYNFRFEEPGADTIVTYPREIKDSMRRKDDTRKKKRQLYKERKEKEKKKCQEEIKMLKNLKKKEIFEKIQKLKEATGNQELPFKLDELEEDFDPEKHDQRMKEVFDDSYYGAEADDTKPCFSDSDPDEDWDHWDEEPQSCRHPEGDGNQEDQKPRSVKHTLLRKRGKHQFDSTDQSLQEYLEEYYKLDYEDIIGDLPCRFKYRKVVPNDFGLSTEEIMSARDQELNAWVSLKKISQYRTEAEENFDVKAYKRKAEDVNKKKKVLASVYGQKTGETGNVLKSTTSATVSNQGGYGGGRNAAFSTMRRKHKQQKPRKNWNHGNMQEEEPDLTDEDPTRQKLKKIANLVENLSDARLTAYGVNPKKLKYRMQHNNPFYKFRRE